MGRYRVRIDKNTGKVIYEDQTKTDKPVELAWKTAISNKETVKTLAKYEKRYRLAKAKAARLQKNPTKTDISEASGDINNMNYGGRPDYKEGEVYNAKKGIIEPDKTVKLTDTEIKNLRDGVSKYYSKGEPSDEPRIVTRPIRGGRKFDPNVVFSHKGRLAEIRIATRKNAIQKQTGLETVEESPDEYHEIPTAELMQSKEAEFFFSEGYDYESSINNLLSFQHKKGMTDDQFFEIVMNSSRDNSKSFREVIERNGKDYPDNLRLTKYSSKLSKQKEELSLRALKVYAAGKLENFSKTDFIVEGIKKGIYTNDDLKAFTDAKGRDFSVIIFKPGNDPKTLEENRRMADLMLGKNLDRSKYTEKEFNELKSKQKAEVFNKRMEEFFSLDYSKLDHMTDEELVDNWLEYSRVFDAIGVFKAEAKKYIGDRYFNSELAKKIIDDIEGKYQSRFFVDSSRIRAIANPYYAKYDFKGFEKLTPNEINNLIYDGAFSGNPVLTNLFKDLGGQHGGYRALLFSDIAYDMNNTADSIIEEADKQLSFFDAKGKLIEDSYEIVPAAKKGAIFVAPKDRPDLLKPYSFDPVNRTINVLDPKSYKKVMAKIRSSMPDITKSWAEEEAMLEGNTVTEKSAYTDFMKGRFSIYASATNLAAQIKNSKDPAKMKEAMLSALKRNAAPHHPDVDYDEYAQIIGMASSEKLSTTTVEERRKLTESVLAGTLEYQLNLPAYSPEMETVFSGTTPRQFSSVMLKSTNTREQNDQIIKDFFEQNEGFDIDGSKKKEMILKRVSEYKTMIDEIYGKSFSDAEIVKNMNVIYDVSIGMGMEFKNTILDNYKQWNVEFTDKELEMMTELHEKANAINDELGQRMAVIGTTYYQFGGADKLAFGENYANYSNLTKDPLFHKSVDNTMNALMFRNYGRGERLLKQVDPTGKQEVEFIYDANGNLVDPKDPATLGKHAFDSGRVFVFMKGQENPVVLDCKDLNDVPPMPSAVEERTPEMEAQIEKMRLDYRLDSALKTVDKNRELSKEMKEHEKNIIYRGYELSIIADSLEKAPQNRQTLKRKLSEYLASVTVKQLITIDKNKKGLDKDSIKELTSNNSIQNLAKDLRKSPIVDLVLDKVLSDPNGFKNIEPQAVYTDMLNLMGKANKIKEEQIRLKNAETKKSMDTVTKNSKIFMSPNGANDLKLYGLSRDLLEALKSATQLGSMSGERASVQTQAFSILLEKGLTVDKILEDSPEMQKMREAAAKQAMIELVGNNAEAIRDHLYIGMKKLNDYMVDRLNSMKDFSVTEMAKPENRSLCRVSTIIKDFFQEFNSVNDQLPKDKRITGEDLDRITSINDLGNKVITPIVAGIQEPLERMVELGDSFDTCKEVGRALNSHLKYLAASAALRDAAVLPENQGKPLEELWNEKTVTAAQIGYAQLVTDERITSLIEKCEDDRALANKVYRSILDDSLRKDLDLKVIYKEGEEFEISMDMNRLVKAMKAKQNADISPSIAQPETKVTQKSEPNAPENQVIQ